MLKHTRDVMKNKNEKLKADGKKIAEIILSAKGPDRTIAKFAEVTGIKRTTLLYMLKGSIVKPLKFDVIDSIINNKAPNCEYTKEDLVQANKMAQETEKIEESSLKKKESKRNFQKLTIDLELSAREYLVYYKETQGVSFGKCINTMIKTFGAIPEESRRALYKYCAFNVKNIHQEIQNIGDSETEHEKELWEQSEAYIGIMRFLSNDDKLSYNQICSGPNLTKIRIKSGYLIYSKEYIIINPEMACVSEYAGIITCRNSEEFGIKHFSEKIPSFIFFSDYKTHNEYTDEFKWQMTELCVKAWPNFRAVLDSQVEPIDDPDDIRVVLNEKEWINSPEIGFMSIGDAGQKNYWYKNRVTPDAYIVRCS